MIYQCLKSIYFVFSVYHMAGEIFTFENYYPKGKNNSHIKNDSPTGNIDNPTGSSKNGFPIRN